MTGIPLDKLLFRRAGQVLDHPNDFSWTTQGFGMIRTYLDDAKQWRLNVWDDRLRVPNVSDIHDHPWDFTSFVLVGAITNTRYHAAGSADVAALPYHRVQIKTGEGGRPAGAQDRVWLIKSSEETLLAPASYRQERTEIHRTRAMPGTVTLNDRSAPTPEYTANVFWQSGPWVNAVPRPATKAEVYAAVEQALHQLRMERYL